METYRPSNRPPRRAKRYVSVYALMTDEGRIDPVRVVWADGRSFAVDEVVERGSFGPADGRAAVARYKVRLGNRVTDLYLERIKGDANRNVAAKLRWWVYTRA